MKLKDGNIAFSRLDTSLRVLWWAPGLDGLQLPLDQVRDVRDCEGGGHHGRHAHVPDRLAHRPADVAVQRGLTTEPVRVQDVLEGGQKVLVGLLSSSLKKGLFLVVSR